MNKKERQEIILKIIEKYEIETQQDLIDKLAVQGLNLTQATVSRDITDLGLTKRQNKNKKSIYVKPIDPDIQKRELLMRQSIVSFDHVNNILVIKTLPGGANTVCAVIDSYTDKDILGSVAGDDTIIVICRDENTIERTVNQLKMYLD